MAQRKQAEADAAAAKAEDARKLAEKLEMDRQLLESNKLADARQVEITRLLAAQAEQKRIAEEAAAQKASAAADAAQQMAQQVAQQQAQRQQEQVSQYTPQYAPSGVPTVGSSMTLPSREPEQFVNVQFARRAAPEPEWEYETEEPYNETYEETYEEPYEEPYEEELPEEFPEEPYEEEPAEEPYYEEVAQEEPLEGLGNGGTVPQRQIPWGLVAGVAGACLAVWLIK